MFAEIIKSVLEALKLAPRYLVAVAAITAFLLFLPEGWLKFLGVDSFAQTNRQWLGLTLVASLSIWIVVLGADFWHRVRKVYRKRKWAQRVITRLQSLTEDEKQILRYYFANGTRANTLKVDDGVVKGLVTAGIIYQSASLGNLLEGFAHNITDNAWDYIHSNPQVLVGSTNTFRTDKEEDLW